MPLHFSLHVLLVLWWLCGGLRTLARVGLEPVSCLFFMCILCFSSCVSPSVSFLLARISHGKKPSAVRLHAGISLRIDKPQVFG